MAYEGVTAAGKLFLPRQPASTNQMVNTAVDQTAQTIPALNPTPVPPVPAPVAAPVLPPTADPRALRHQPGIRNPHVGGAAQAIINSIPAGGFNGQIASNYLPGPGYTNIHERIPNTGGGPDIRDHFNPGNNALSDPNNPHQVAQAQQLAAQQGWRDQSQAWHRSHLNYNNVPEADIPAVNAEWLSRRPAMWPGAKNSGGFGPPTTPVVPRNPRGY